MPAVSKQVVRKVSPVKVAKTGTAWDRIGDIDEDNQFMKILLYGRSGTGKTTTWATFPGPILAIICSGGMKPGELKSIDTPANRTKIKKIVLQSTQDMKEIIEGQAATNTFKTLVLDHVSGLQDLKLKEVLGIDEIPAQKSWGLASQQQYGQVTLECKEYLRAMLNLDANIVIIGQERSDKEDRGGGDDLIAPTIGVATTPSLAGWLNPAVDFICQTFIRPNLIHKDQTIGKGPAAKTISTVTRGEGVQYCMRTAPHDVYTTKFRVPKGYKLPDVIVDPSYDKIMEVLKGLGK
jgi:hypothetical protein